MEGEGGKTPTARMKDAGTLASRGLHAEALAEYLWCYEHGDRYDPSFTAIRYSFLLGFIAKLGRVYPPALDELRRRRSAAEAGIFAGQGTPSRVREFAALNQALGEPERTTRAFESISRRPGDQIATAAILEFATSALVEARRYEDVVRAAGDVGTLLKRRLTAAGKKLKTLREGRAENAVQKLVMQEYAQAEFVQGADYYEALLGTGRVQEAMLCTDILLEFVPGGSSYALLIRRAIRAGALDAARTMARRGLDALVGAERDVVLSAAAEI